jgi:hypothetical protein
MTRTSKADFALFKRECERLISRWGVSGWRIEYRHEKVADGYAQIQCSSPGRAIILTFTTVWPDKRVSRAMIMEAAEHEVTHALLAPLYSLAYEGRVPKAMAYTTTEAVTRHVQQAIAKGVR